MEEQEQPRPLSAESVGEGTSEQDAFAPAPIEARLDNPAEGISIAGVVEVSGWAFSRAAPIVTVQATLAGAGPCALRYGASRTDVVAAFPDEAPPQCGYSGRISTDPGASGAATLSVRIVDAEGNEQEMTRLVYVRPSRVRLAVDLPAAQSASSGPLVIRGWAFSYGAQIVDVSACLGERAPHVLTYGVLRPDVAAWCADPRAERCGFEGELDFEDVDTERDDLLVVCVTDAFGERAEVHVPVRLVMPPEPQPVGESVPAWARVSPIAAGLDGPTEGSTLAGIVALSGWAFSRAAPIVEVEASIGEATPCALHYGDARSDMVAAFPDPPPLRCGYTGQIAVDPGTPAGATTLRVRIVDARGNQLEISRAVSVRPPRVRLWIDEPIADAVSGGTLMVRGWAFSPGARIVEVQAWLVNRTPGVLAYGFHRPDVVAAHTAAEALRSGFEGELTFEPNPSRPTERLVVHAVDDLGEIAEAEITIRTAMPREGRCEIERARWSGDHLQVEGWVAWPEGVPPRRHRVLIDDALVGQIAVNRSRPDLRRRCPAYPAGSLRGFRLSALFAPSARQVGGRARLTIECVDADGRRLERTTSIVHERHAGTADASQETLLRIEQAVASVRERLAREPTILDWHAGLSPAAFVSLVLFSPSQHADTTVLPYLDGSVDVVVVKAGTAARVAEARRVAAVATVEIQTGASAEPSGGVTLCWQGDAPGLRSFPTTSIIIPVHNHVQYTDACLTQLMATLPPRFGGEIIVVDDASTDETQAVLDRWTEASPLVRVLRNDENVGFLRSCNRGADAAIGEIVVFLNNDTLPQPGWLPPLLRLLRDDPSAGAVGGKLLYPDGTLQEAGGVIFSDASGCNFGRNDPNPGDPLYSFLREVDYCSGALLAIRRAVLLEMGGFDTEFSPAYYEDTDLCFRLREKGYRVYYQPESRVVHVEGATSGTDPQAGAKRYQVVNREKFTKRWRAALQEQPVAPARLDAAARHALSTRHGRPRALVCALGMPEFDRESGSARTFHLIEFLRDAGFAVSFLALDSIAGERYLRLLQQHGVATYAGPDSREAGDEYLENIDELVGDGRFDLALLVLWEIAEQLLPRFRSLSPRTRVVVDSVDLHFLRGARSVLHRSPGHERGSLGGDYADRMTRELNTYAAADAVLTVSQKEADLINDMTADPALAHAVADMEELPRSARGFGERRGLLFVGNFRHPPNLEALEYLCRQILPHLDPGLLRDHPLYVVGNQLDDGVRRVAGDLPHVRLVGWVPSLLPYLERVRVSVIPLLHGAGTKRKLIQALMVGTPSVSTWIGVEGLALTHGEHVLVADAAADFATQLTALVESPELWQRLATQGRAHIERAHGRAAVQARLESVVTRVMSQSTAAGLPGAAKR